MMELGELSHAEKYLTQAEIKCAADTDNSLIYADLCLLKIKQSEFVQAWEYMQIAMKKKHTETHNRLMLLYLHYHLVQIDLDNHECASLFNLGMLVCANYF